MKSVVLSVFDQAIQAYGRPMFFQTLGVAIRSFTDEVNRVSADNGLQQHPEDYDLRYIADFDEDSGEFVLPENGARVLVRAKDVLRKPQ